MKKLKKVLVYLLTLCCLLNTVSNNLMIASAATTCEVVICGEGGTFDFSEPTFTSPSSNWQTLTYDADTTLRSNGVSVKDPVMMGSIFNGWLECTYYMDPVSCEPVCSPVNGTVLYSTEDIMDYVLPAGNIGFMASWSVDPNYMPPSTGNEWVNVFFYGNGTELTIDRYGMTDVGESQGDMFEAGTTVASHSGNYMIQTPVYWDGQRQFLGWNVCTLQWVTNPSTNMMEQKYVQEMGTTTMSTTDMMNYPIPNYEIYFIAQWAGMESDYYTNVMFDAYGADLVYNEYWFDGNGQYVPNTMYNQCTSFNLREDGTTIGSQLTYKFELVSSPSRMDANFEGWIKFNVTQQIDPVSGMSVQVYQLVDQTIYTDAQMMSTVVPDENIVFTAKWDTIDFDAYYQGPPSGGTTNPPMQYEMMFYGDGGEFQVTDSMTSGHTTVWHNFWLESNESLSTKNYSITDPVKSGWIFDGWLECTYYSDPMTGMPVCTPVPGVNPVSTMMAMTYFVGTSNVAFVAAWSVDPNYVPPTYVDVIFEGNGGEFDVDRNQNTFTGFKTYSLSGMVGTTLASFEPTFSVTNPVFWDSNRGFIGWVPCREVPTYDNQGMQVGVHLEAIQGVSPLSTFDALNTYVIPNEKIIFQAKYAGNDDDYFTTVQIEGYGQMIEIGNIYLDGNGVPTMTTYLNGGWTEKMKKNGQSIDAQIGHEFTIASDPTKPGATFEGWLEFKITLKTNNNGGTYWYYELVDDTTYSTAQMLAKAVPTYDVAYVAKWSDIAADDYYAEMRNVSIIVKAEPGRFAFTDTMHNSQGTYNGIENMYTKGKTLATCGVTITDPSERGLIFQGWKLNDVTYTQNGPVFNPVQGVGLFTTAQMLAYTLPDDPIAFIAEWVQDTRPTVNPTFAGRGGMITFDSNGNRWTDENVGEFIPQGTTLAENNITVSNPVYWTNRTFEGWLPCKETFIDHGDGTGHWDLVEIPNANVMSTADVLQLVMTEDITFVAQWEGEDKDYTSHVYIHGYGYKFTFTEIQIQNGNVTTTDIDADICGDELREDGTGFATQLSDYFLFKTEPSRADADFEGWLAFEVVTEVDENGFETERFYLVDDTLYNTQQMLALPVPHYDVAYVAKWSDIDAEDYFPFNGSMEPNGEHTYVRIEANGGEFVFEYTDGPETREDYDNGFFIGATLKQHGVQIQDPEYWDVDRNFAGWNVYEVVEFTNSDGCVDYEHVLIQGAENLTTEQLLNFELPNCEIRIVAQWAGDDNDYYSKVIIDGYGEGFGYEEYYYDDHNNLATNTGIHYTWENYLKENNESLQDQVGNEFAVVADPTKEDATFEGWLEFKVTEKTNSFGEEYKEYELVSNLLLSTGDIFAKPVPAYDVAYIAKWSDIELVDYFKNDNAVEVVVDGNVGGFDVYNTVTGKHQSVGSIAEIVKIDSTWASTNLQIGEVQRVGWLFDGWMVCTVEYDEDGPVYTQIPGTSLLSQDELNAYPIPNYDIAFVAQWVVDDRPVKMVSFEGLGGEFDYQTVYESGTTSWYNGVHLIGSKVSDFVTVTDPVYWNPNREFLGWMVCRVEEFEDEHGDIYQELVQVPGTALISTEAALDYEVPSFDIYFEAQWGGKDEDYYSVVGFDAYGGTFEITGTFYDEEGNVDSTETVEVDEFGEEYREDGSAIENRDGYDIEISADPIKRNSTFEGWMMYTFAEKEYADGTEYIEYTLVDDTLYTSAQVMAMTVPHDDIVFVAKWDDMDVEDYFPFNGAKEPYGNEIEVVFDGNGGIFILNDANVSHRTESYGKCFVTGTTLKQYKVSLIDPKFWDANRAFLGWMAMHYEEVEDPRGGTYEMLVQIPGTSIMTSTEVVNYILPNHNVRFVAVWDGNDDDYYSDVVFEGYEGGTFKEYTWGMDGSGNPIKVYNDSQGTGFTLRENGETIGNQLAGKYGIVADPVRAGSTFEGWLVFKTVVLTDDTGFEDINHSLVSETLYTTQEIMDMVLPEYNVTFAAKWSDIPTKEYYRRPINVHLVSNGGQFIAEVLDANGQWVETTASSIGQYFPDCYNVEDGLERVGIKIVDIVRECKKITEWKVYQYQFYDYVDMPAGQELNVGDPEMVFVYFTTWYDENGDGFDTYLGMYLPVEFTVTSIDEILELEGYSYYAIPTWEDAHAVTSRLENVVEPTTEAAGSYDKVYYCADCGTVLQTVQGTIEILSQPVVVEGSTEEFKVESKTAVTEVPETIVEQFETVAEIETALEEKALETVTEFVEDKVVIEMLDVELKVKDEETGEWTVVDDTNFPEAGVTLTLPYPVGTNSEDFDFVVTHMITTGELAGTVEILVPTLKADGIEVTVTSLSPIGIVYQEKEEPTDPVDPPSGGDSTGGDSTGGDSTGGSTGGATGGSTEGTTGGTTGGTTEGTTGGTTGGTTTGTTTIPEEDKKDTTTKEDTKEEDKEEPKVEETTEPETEVEDAVVEDAPTETPKVEEEKVPELDDDVIVITPNKDAEPNGATGNKDDNGPLVIILVALAVVLLGASVVIKRRKDNMK